MARTLATGAGLLIIATTVSFVPSNEWSMRVLDFPRLQIAVFAGLLFGVLLSSLADALVRLSGMGRGVALGLNPHPVDRVRHPNCAA